MGGNRFDQIAKEILQKKQLMDDLKEENHELRRQLTDLKAGRGIFIEIYGQRFALLTNEEVAPFEYNPTQSYNENTPIKVTASAEALQEESVVEEPLAPTSEDKEPELVEAAKTKATTFLEEVMIDEFSSALTSPLAATQKAEGEQENINEEQKALLRQQLLGSYLLE